MTNSKTIRAKQIEMVCLEDLVSSNHIYRKFLSLWNLDLIKKELELLEVTSDHKGYGIFRIFLCLLLQFLEDLSDRELERFIRENAAARWFCDFNLIDETPDHSVFGRARARIGTNKLSKIFSLLRDQLKSEGYMSEVFTFVDATHLIAKANLWSERDKAIELKLEKLNNKTLEKVATDKDARFGAKGKNKIWYGYKQHTSVDMQSGMINKIAITPANIIDSKGFKHVTPKQGAVYADKGYCDKNAQTAAKIRNLHLAAVKKNNMKNKNYDLDRYYTKLRAPFEHVFSKQNKKVRYKGIAKNQFQAFMHAITFNLKRLVVLTANIQAPPVFST
jgi:IS5 family transposase